MWTYVRDDRPAGDPSPPAVWYRYSRDRTGEHPRGHLENFRGIIQADAYAGYNALYADGSVVEAACVAHARRKVHEQYVVGRSPIATEAIHRFRELYAIEKEIRGKRPEQRLAVRRERSAPLADAMQTWLTVTLQTVSSKSKLADAIRYSLVRWTALTRRPR